MKADPESRAGCDARHRASFLSPNRTAPNRDVQGRGRDGYDVPDHAFNVGWERVIAVNEQIGDGIVAGLAVRHRVSGARDGSRERENSARNYSLQKLVDSY
jgi:hypothetical protein